MTLNLNVKNKTIHHDTDITYTGNPYVKFNIDDMLNYMRVSIYSMGNFEAKIDIPTIELREITLWLCWKLGITEEEIRNA